MPKHYSAEDLKRMKDTLDASRNILDSTLDACLFYYMPEFQNESYYRNETHVSEENQPLKPVGQDAVNKLAAGIFSNTVAMGEKFFGFRTNSEELNDNESVRRWFADAAMICLQQMQNSNFAMMMHETILYYCALETGILHIEYDGEGMSYQNYPVTQCSLSENKDGIVNTLFRRFEMTAQQAMERWGDDNSQEIKDAATDPSLRFAKYPFFHAVITRQDRDPDRVDNKNMKYASYYVDERFLNIVEESGYDSFPYACPRFLRTSTSAYGRGSAFSALPLLREIDRIEADIIDGVELKIQPPVFLPAGMVQEDVDLTPAAVNYYNPQQGQIVFYQPEIDVNSAREHQAQLEESVNSLLFTDLFMMLEDRKNMTATEVQARLGEKVQAITPVVNRLYDELFKVTIIRTLDLLVKNQVIPQPPEELQGVDYTVEYTTKLTSMMKAVEVETTMRSIQQAAGIYELTAQMPQLAHVINIDKVIKQNFEANNISTELVYSEEETEDLRADAAAQAQAQQQQQMIQDKIAPIDPMKAPEDGSIAQSMGEEGIGI